VSESAIKSPLTAAFALSSAGGSMAAIKRNAHNHAPMSSSSVLGVHDGHSHAHESERAAVLEVIADELVGVADHDHDGSESSCCVMCHFAVEMPFPVIVHACPTSVIQPPGQHAVRPGLNNSLERPPRAVSVRAG
jgi:hypothetical protein